MACFHFAITFVHWTTIIFQMFVPPVSKSAWSSLCLCEFMFEKMWWLTVIEGCLCGASSSVHYERFMASYALSVCFLFLAPGPMLILPWTFAAEGLRRTGGGWIWIAVQVCACSNLRHPPSPLGLCTILFEFKCVAEEKVPLRFPVKLYSGPLILLGCHIGPF